MFAYIVRRSFVGFIMLIVMSLVTFMLFFAAPIHPERYACGKNCSPAQQEQTKKALGYDKPAIVQWTDFLKGIVQGRTYPDDEALRKAAPQNVVALPGPVPGLLGRRTRPRSTRRSRTPSRSRCRWRWSPSSCGWSAACSSASSRHSRRAPSSTAGSSAISLIFYAFPTFFIGLFLLKFLAIKWQVVPIPEYVSIADGGVGPWLQGLLLPSLTLALFFMAGYVRMTRAFVLESLGEDYLRTAKAKGLAPRRVLVKHSMRAALTPLVTMAGLDLAGLMGGAIITETVFNYFGLGKLAVDANQTFDLPTDRRAGAGAGRGRDHRQHHRRHPVRRHRPARAGRLRSNPNR